MPEQEVVEQPVTDPPVEKPAEVAAETPQEAKPEAEAAPKTEETPERDEKGKFRKPIQPRIDELTRQKHEAEREAAYWRGVAQSAQPSAKADAPKRPDAKDFQSPDEYVEALAEWKAGQLIESTLQKRDAEVKQTQAKTERESKANAWAERVAKFAESTPDFAEVLDSAETQIPGHVLEALLESNKGPELAYHLAKHPADAERIGRMSERQAYLELGKLEASLKPALKSVTKAPAPITPVKSGGGNVIDLNKASQAEYEAHRKAQGAWWAR